MRQLIIQVPLGKGKKVLEIAKNHGGVNLWLNNAQSDRGEIEVVTVHLDNHTIESYLEELEVISDLHITLIPRGVIALQPPPDEAPDRSTDITPRSPIEIF